MRLKILDYQCRHCGVIGETMNGNDPAPSCLECGGDTVYKVASPRFVLEGTSGSFPTAADKWVKRRQEKMKLEQKRGHRPAGQDDHL